MNLLTRRQLAHADLAVERDGTVLFAAAHVAALRLNTVDWNQPVRFGVCQARVVARSIRCTQPLLMTPGFDTRSRLSQKT